jgi:acetyl esterase
MTTPFDPGLADFIRRSDAAPIDTAATLDAQRAAYTAFARSFDLPDPPGLERTDLTLDGPAGPIPARLYRPRPGRLPVIAYFHGGGFVLGNPDTHDSFTADLAAAADAALVSVDYRLAPEHPFPAAFDDCLAATRGIAAAAAAWGLDGSRLAVAGDSAGGNLAAAVALALRDAAAPNLRGQALIYPMLGLDFETESYVRNAEAPMLTRAAARGLAALYLPSGFDAADWRAAPLLAPSLAGLPPAFVTVAEHDPVRDDGILYAMRLAEAGVPSVLSRAPGLVHGWVRARGMSAAAGVEYRRLVAELRAMLA